MPRANFRPTDENRKMVTLMSACGMTHEQIAIRIGIRSPKTLRKHFRHELDCGSIDANTRAAQTLFKMATSGNYPAATIFWLKSRAGWKDRPQFEAANIERPPFIVARENGAES